MVFLLINNCLLLHFSYIHTYFIIEEKSYIMTFVGTSKEKFFYYNTLLCLVKSLQNKHITVDLRNDSYVCGELAIVDG